MNKLFSLVLIMMFCISFTTALEFDNVKSYDANTQTVIVKNGFGLGGDIAKIKLNTPLHYKVPLGYQKVAEFTITSYKDYSNSLKELELFDKRNGMNKFIRAYDYKYLTYEDVVIDDYETTCIKKQYVNGSNYDDCTSNIIGSHTEQREKWIKLTPADLKKNEIITIGIFTEVQNKDLVEWIPNMFGVRVNEWATWEASLNVGLQAYYSLENSAEDIYGTNDGVLTLGGYDINGKRDVGINTSTDGINFNTTYNQSGGDLTVNFWLKSTAVAGDGNTVMCFRSDYPCGTTPTGAGHLQFYWGGSGNGFHADFFDGSRKQAQKNTGWTLNTWHMVSLITNSTSVVVYIDAVNGTQTAASFTPIGIANIISLQLSGFAGNIIQQDEVMIWNRSLTQTELTTLYDSGTGTFYTANTAPTITLNSPPNINQSTSSLTFNWTADDDNQVDNSTLWINGVINQTITHGTSNSTNEQVTLNFADGSYNWTVTADDNEGSTGTTDTRFFTIDTVDPTVTIAYPSNGAALITSTIPLNVSLNFTASDNNLGSCWYYNGTANNTLTCGTNSSILLNAGSHTVYYYANDTAGNLASTSSTFSINYVYENVSYSNPAVEQETYSFKLNITATTITSFNGTIYYNNVAYPTNYSHNGSIGQLTSNVQANSLGNTSIYWNYWLNGNNYNSSTYYQQVYPIQNLTVTSSSCPAGLSMALHYDFKDEKNDTILNLSTNYIFRYGVTNNTLRTTAGNYTNIDQLNICINSTVWNNYSIGYGEVQYEATGYSERRYYTFNGDRLSNITTNNTLYSLLSGSSTSFLFTIQKGDLSVFNDVYLTLNRWYPNEDTYKVVEMSRTDDQGQTVMKVEIEDVDYRVGVYYQNGTLVYLAAPFRLVCIAAPCSYSLIVPEDAGNTFENWANLQVSLVFNTTTNVFTLTYNDPSQNTDTINLSVWRDTGRSTLLICTDSASSYTGVLSCNVSGYTGTLRAVAFRTASPQTAVISKIVSVGSAALGKVPALFITMLIMIFLVSVGIVSPILTVILAVLGFIPALIFGILPLAILLIIAAMGFIVIHFIKRSAG